MTTLIETYYTTMDLAKAIRSTIRVLRELKERDQANAVKYERSIKSLQEIIRDMK